jgi:hypothetical protein
MKLRIPSGSKPLVDLAIQLGVGALAFVCIGVVALALALFVRWLGLMGAPEWLVTSTHYLEIGVYGLDVFCFGLFLVNEAIKFARKLDWKS